nr:hypothetical protein [uncultured Noviherbaspirillum sp.]
MKKSNRLQAKPDLFKIAESACDSTTPLKFLGTDNPRHLRAIQALWVRPMGREQLDRLAGCSNGPALIAELRSLGLGKVGLPCTMIGDRDRDGCAIRRGVYSLSEVGRRAINYWLSKRNGGVK